LLSIVVGLAGAGAVTGAAWSIQTLGLPLPARPARVAADATRWFAEHRAVVDIFQVDRKRLTGICVAGWFGAGNGRLARGSLLALSSGPKFVIVGGKVRSENGFHRRAASPPLAATVGCARSIEQALLLGEQAVTHLSSERASAAGRPAIALELQSARRRFTLYVAARTYKPLVAILHTRRETVTARLYLPRRMPTLLARFGLSKADVR
jgi:hypothetical protein